MKFLKTHKNVLARLPFFLLLAIFILHFAFRVYQYRGQYLSRFDPTYWQYRYDNSQWVIPVDCPSLIHQTGTENYRWCVKNHSMSRKQIPLGDDGLYTYEGWKYVQGSDPTILNAEVPPLGKYLIGVSILIFHNQNIFALSSGIFALIAFFLFSLHIFKNKTLALLPVTIFSLEPLFYTQLRAPFLDLVYLGFFLMTSLFFLQRRYLLSFLFLGLMMATKSSASTFVIVFASEFLYLLLQRISKKKTPIKMYIVSIPVAFIVFSLTYLGYFLHGHNIKELIGVQKYIVHFYATGVKGSLLVPWQLLFIGRWQTWFGGVKPIPEWNIGWPVAAFATIAYAFSSVMLKKMEEMSFLLIWITIYIIFLSFVPLFPRYLLLLLPFLYSLATWFLSKKVTH